MSIFLLCHLHPPVLLFLRIVQACFLEHCVSKVGDCLIGHHQRWWSHMSGVGSLIGSRLWHSLQMVSTSSQARTIKQFVCGTPLRERQWRAHLADTRIGSRLWHSLQMASTSSQARTIELFVCGTPRRERQWRVHLVDTRIGSCLWRSLQMASTLAQAPPIEQFVCGTS